MTATVTPKQAEVVVDLREIETPEPDRLHVVRPQWDDRWETDRRSSDSVDQLSREMNEACTTAVTPHQIAALLEAEGLNDRIVQERYGRSSVFSLASELYDRVPLRRSDERSAEETLDHGGPQPSTLALIMRGPIYLAPMVFLLAVGSTLSLEPLLWAGMLALLLAWSWKQGFGALVYRLIGRGDVSGAQRMAQVSLVAGTVLVTLIVWLIVGVVLDAGSIVLFTAGQTAYLIAAATMLTFAQDRILILALLPGLVVAGVSIAIPAVPDQIAFASMIVTLFIVLIGMVWVTRDGTWAGLPRLTRFDLSIAGFQALLGLVWATLIGLAGLSIAGTPNMLTTVSIAAAPMVLTMGVAEWQLQELRHNTREILIETGDPREFAHRVRSSFTQSTAIFTAALVGVTLLVGSGVYVFGTLTGMGAMLAFGFIWLGLAFFAGLGLVSLDRIVIPLAVSIYAAAFMAYLLAAAPDRSVASAGVYAAGCFGLAVALIAAVNIVTPKVVAHR